MIAYGVAINKEIMNANAGAQKQHLRLNSLWRLNKNAVNSIGIASPEK